MALQTVQTNSGIRTEPIMTDKQLEELEQKLDSIKRRFKRLKQPTLEQLEQLDAEVDIILEKLETHIAQYETKH